LFTDLNSTLLIRALDDGLTILYGDFHVLVETLHMKNVLALQKNSLIRVEIHRTDLTLLFYHSYPIRRLFHRGVKLFYSILKVVAVIDNFFSEVGHILLVCFDVFVVNRMSV